jgi:multiple sugar transport system permease protein
MGPGKIALNMGGLLEGYDKLVALPLLPSYPTLKHYRDLLLYADRFYKMFWNSCLYSVSTVLGQLIISAPAAFVMAVCKFRGKRLLFWIYIIVMLMPFQVVMLSEYLVLKSLAIINTPLAVILLGIFSTYPVFILTKVFETILTEIVEAGKLDGAEILRIFTNIFLPIGKGGLMSVCVRVYRVL